MSKIHRGKCGRGVGRERPGTDPRHGRRAVPLARPAGLSSRRQAASASGWSTPLRQATPRARSRGRPGEGCWLPAARPGTNRRRSRSRAPRHEVSHRPCSVPTAVRMRSRRQPGLQGASRFSWCRPTWPSHAASSRRTANALLDVSPPSDSNSRRAWPARTRGRGAGNGGRHARSRSPGRGSPACRPPPRDGSVGMAARDVTWSRPTVTG